jgi:hypothetical protein
MFGNATSIAATMAGLIPNDRNVVVETGPALFDCWLRQRTRYQREARKFKVMSRAESLESRLLENAIRQSSRLGQAVLNTASVLDAFRCKPKGKRWREVRLDKVPRPTSPVETPSSWESESLNDASFSRILGVRFLFRGFL